MCRPITPIKVISKEIPLYKGNKRVWIETKVLNDTNFSELSYDYKLDHKKKQLLLTPSGSRKVSVRRDIPIIDINNKEISELFDGIDKIIIKIFSHEIIIEPLKESLEQLRAKRKLNSKTLTYLEVFAGGGTLSKALVDAGLQCVGAIELDDKYLSNFEKNHPNTFTYNGDVTSLDDSLLPDAVVLAAGIPCDCFGNTGITGKKAHGKKAKEAGDTGSLAYHVLSLVEKIRPALVLIEQVPGFAHSAIGDIVRSVLKVRGYNLAEQIIPAAEYGSLSRRERFVLVASIGKQFSFNKQRFFKIKTIGDILEIPLEDREWLTKENSNAIAMFLRNEIEHKNRGNNFKMARTHVTDTVVKTITKGYYKNRLTDPILVNPNNPNQYSFFTPRELARINGLPDNFILPETKTTAGEIIGQGVAYDMFYSIGRELLSYFESHKPVKRPKCQR